MRDKGVLVCLTFLFMIVSCRKDESIPMEKTIIEELPVFFEKRGQSNLIPEKEIRNKILVLNSHEDVRNSFSASFLKKYPSYMKVAFDQYSLLVRTAPVHYDIVSRKIFVYWDPSYQFYRYQVHYEVGALCEDGDYYIERTAVVVNKMDESTRVEAGYSVSKGL